MNNEILKINTKFVTNRLWALEVPRGFETEITVENYDKVSFVRENDVLVEIDDGLFVYDLKSVFDICLKKKNVDRYTWKILFVKQNKYSAVEVCDECLAWKYSNSYSFFGSFVGTALMTIKTFIGTACSTENEDFLYRDIKAVINNINARWKEEFESYQKLGHLNKTINEQNYSILNGEIQIKGKIFYKVSYDTKYPSNFIWIPEFVLNSCLEHKLLV